MFIMYGRRPRKSLLRAIIERDLASGHLRLCYPIRGGIDWLFTL